MWLSEIPFECPQYLLDKAKNLPSSRVAVVNAQSTPVLESVAQAIKENLISPILIGDKNKILEKAATVELDVAKIKLLSAADDYQAVELATSLVNQGEADCIMKGHIHTDDFLRGLIDKEKGVRGQGFMTHIFHMTVPNSDRPLLITDAAIHVAPNEKAMKSIIANAVELAHKLGFEKPKVALLSASETVNEAVPSTQKASDMAVWAKENLAGLEICGPLAFDVAISENAAKLKGLTDSVAGLADILIVPQIETGNVLFKTLVYFKSACAAGIVMGAKVPVVLTSRADPAEARLASIAIAAILSSS